MVKQRWRRGTSHIDLEKQKYERETKAALHEAFQCGNETKYFELVQQANPNLTHEELDALRALFRKADRNP